MGKTRKTARLRLRQAEALLPEMLRLAREIHGTCEPIVKLAVLTAWGSLAGVLGWNSRMVDRVEQEMAK